MGLGERATSAFWRVHQAGNAAGDQMHLFLLSLWALGCFYVSRGINARIWVLQIRHVLGIKPPHCAPGQVLGHGVLWEGRGAGGGRMRDLITATLVLQLLS